jgi:hypothetical protein
MEDAEKLSQIADSIGDKIESRQDQDEMLKTNEHIINPAGLNRRLSGALASTAKDLEKKITSDKIDRHLGSRPEAEELEKLNMLNTNVAPSIQGVQKKLQRKMSSDELAHRLEHRPDVQELKDHGIVKGMWTRYLSTDWRFLTRFDCGYRGCCAESAGHAGQASAPDQLRPREPTAHQATVH